MSLQSNTNASDSTNNQAIPADSDINMEETIEEQILAELEFHLQIHREFGEYKESVSARLDHMSATIDVRLREFGTILDAFMMLLTSTTEHYIPHPPAAGHSQ